LEEKLGDPDGMLHGLRLQVRDHYRKPFVKIVYEETISHRRGTTPASATVTNNGAIEAVSEVIAANSVSATSASSGMLNYWANEDTGVDDNAGNYSNEDAINYADDTYVNENAVNYANAVASAETFLDYDLD
jgi:hypothetical protein